MIKKNKRTASGLTPHTHNFILQCLLVVHISYCWVNVQSANPPPSSKWKHLQTFISKSLAFDQKNMTELTASSKITHERESQKQRFNLITCFSNLSVLERTAAMLDSKISEALQTPQ